MQILIINCLRHHTRNTAKRIIKIVKTIKMYQNITEKTGKFVKYRKDFILNA